MKIKKILFNIFAVIAILTIAVIIVVQKNNNKQNLDNTTSSEIAENLNNNNNNVSEGDNSSNVDENLGNPNSQDNPNNEDNSNPNNEDNSNPNDESGGVDNTDVDNTDQDNVNNNDDSASEGNKPDGDVNTEQNDSEKDDIVYAESVVLNCPETIEIPINTPLILKDGFASTIPSQASANIKLEAGAKYSSSHTDISLSGRTVVLSKIGIYKITVSAPNSKTKWVSKTITIKGVDKPNANVEFKDTTLTVDQNYSVCDLIVVSGFNNVNYITDNNLLLQDDKFTAKNQGETILKVKCEQPYYYLMYTKSFTIKPKPKFMLSTDKDVYEVKLGDVVNIYYYISVDNQICAEQNVLVSIVDASKAILHSKDSPSIIVIPISTGETNIRIEYKADASVFKEIKLIIT